MTCEVCRVALNNDEDQYEHNGKKLCEDCYIKAIEGPKSCDHSVVENIVSKRLNK